MRFVLFPLLFAATLLTGCSLSPTIAPSAQPAIALQGGVHGGQQPIVGAHVYLFAANTTGYGQASVSLLNAAATGHSDSVGAYVLTNASGAFSITGDYACTPDSQVYVYALGGNPGAGVNSASGLLAILGNCPNTGNFLGTAPFLYVNEVSTVAAAYAFAGFATDATHVSSSGTALAKTGIANAFATASNLASLSTGVALTTTPSGNGAVPQTTINTLANILASCVNTSGPNSATCSTLLSDARSGGAKGTAPTDTATAAINIAHHPGINIGALFALTPAVSPFVPSLPASPQPNDFTLAIRYTGGSLLSAADLAIDATGNVWIANQGTLVELSSAGYFVSGTDGFSGGGLNVPFSIAIDSVGSVWLANTYSHSISKFSSAGVPNPSSPFTGGSISTPFSLSVDGSDNLWVADYDTGVGKFTSAGVSYPGAPYTGSGVVHPAGFGLDGSGHTWLYNLGQNVVELSSAGTNLTQPNGFVYAKGSPRDLAMDAAGNAWVVSAQNIVTEISGTTREWLSGDDGYTGGGINNPMGIAMDGLGNAWIANADGHDISEISNAGAVLSPNGYYLASLVTATSIAIDGSGNTWVGDGDHAIVEFIGAAGPVVTPLSAGVKNNTVATRP